jgi:phage head maturation protease
MPFDAPSSALGLKQIFGTILKVEDQEDGTIKVYGVASSEARDGAGELVRAKAMEDALPDYSKFPALREMHQPVAAGKVLEAEVDGDGVTQIVAHVVDPVAIVKVRTGVYAGFSIGGKVLKRDSADRSIITALRLVEISLVDSPCNPDAVLTMWKAETMSDYTPPRDEVVARAKELAKAAGHGKRYAEHLFDAAEELKAEHVLKAIEAGEVQADDVEAVAAVETPAVAEVVEEPASEPGAEAPAADTAEPAGEKEAAAQPEPNEEDHAGEEAEEPAATAEEGKEAAADVDPTAALTDAIAKGNEVLEATAPPTPEDPFADLERVANALKGISIGEAESPLAKSMYEVSRFADLLCSFSYVQRCLACEAEQEGDGSTIPAELATAINNLGDLLVRLAQEEVAELVASLRVPEGESQVEIIYCGDECAMAESIVDLVKADAELMAKALERRPAPEPKEELDETDTEAGATIEAAADADRIGELEAENESLKKSLADAAPAVEKLVSGFQAQIDELKKRFEDEPIPPKTAGPATTRAIAKTADSAGGANAVELGAEGVTLSDEQLEKHWAGLSEAERGHILMKAALQQPHVIATRAIGPQA